MNFITEKVTFKVPLTSRVHQIAEKLRKEQRFPERAKQVYLNTLAVLAVNSYLQCMGIETDLIASNSQNRVMTILSDTADLIIKNIGKLECRPLLPNQEFVHIPLEAQDDRIGYMVVQMNESLREATLLGFVKELATEEFPINQLQSLEDFLEHIETLSQVTVTQSVNMSKNIDTILAWIKNTLENICDLVEPIFEDDSETLIPEFRNGQLPIAYEGIKEINLVSAIGRQSLKVTKILEAVNDSGLINVFIDVSSMDSHIPLPPDLKLQALNKDNRSIFSCETEENDTNIRLEFSRQFGEPFSVKLVLSGEDIQSFECK